MLNFPFKSNMGLSKWSSNSTLRQSSSPSMDKIRTYSVNEPTRSPAADNFNELNESGAGKCGGSCPRAAERAEATSENNFCSHRSNLDIFLDLTSNPFTTKFEIIGDQKRADEDKNLVQVFDVTPDKERYILMNPIYEGYAISSHCIRQ